jgi:chromate reductase
MEPNGANQIKVAVFVGSLREQSINRRLALAFTKVAPENFEFEFVDIGSIPHFNQDEEYNPAESVTRMKQQVLEADALMFVIPEYNRSMPGVFKNALDQGSRPYGESVFDGKPALIAGASIGPISTAVAQQHLRSVLAFLNVFPLAQPEVFIYADEDLIDMEGNVSVDDTREFFREVMREFARFLERFEPGQQS